MAMGATTRNGKVAINSWNGTSDVVDGGLSGSTAEESAGGDDPDRGLCRALGGIGTFYRDTALGLGSRMHILTHPKGS